MTIHFITASRGGDDPHVTSADDARQNVAHIGNGNYVGKTGDQLSASMTSPNTLRILSGDGWICGRHWSIDGFEDVTIENGNPGYNRKDLVVFHAETSPSESGEIVVIKGEETTGDAVVPSYTEGDLNDGDTVAEMPLYVVSLNGVSVNDPEPQFDVLVPYNDFRDSISQYSTSETTTGKTWIDGKPIYRKVIEFGAMSGNNRYTIAHGIEYETITYFSAICFNSTNSALPLARVGYDGKDHYVEGLSGYAYITADNVIIIGGSQTNYVGANVVLEYTKA